VIEVDGVSEIVGVTEGDPVTDTDGVIEGVGEEDVEGTATKYGCDMSQQNLFGVSKFVSRYNPQPYPDPKMPQEGPLTAIYPIATFSQI
jgi:hypothetical protein